MKQNVPIFVRPERPQDHPAVFDVNLRAFGRPAEARLVELLRASARPNVSLVALADGKVVGHVLFTPLRIEGGPPRLAMGLGPLAVRPEYQRQGIGSRLVNVGLDACRISAVDLVFVLGEPRLYRRLGFVPAQPYGLIYKNPSFAPYFMVRELRPGSLADATGQVHYHAEFDQMEAAAEQPAASHSGSSSRLGGGGCHV
jgi:putative acetyltransferase